MANIECEKIIDQVVDPKHLNDQCKQHIKGCKECAATIACLLWLKTKGSPTTDLKPSQAFLDKIENSLGAGAGAGSAIFSSKTFLAAALGVALATAVAFGLLSRGQSPTESLPATTKNPARSENKILNEQPAPTLKFSSPADDVD